MPSAAQWLTLMRKAEVTLNLLDPILGAADTFSVLEHEVLKDAKTKLKEVTAACEEWFLASSGSSFDKMLLRTTGSTSAYEVAKEHFRSAHEATMLMFIVEQRKSAESAMQGMEGLYREIQKVDINMVRLESSVELITSRVASEIKQSYRGSKVTNRQAGSETNSLASATPLFDPPEQSWNQSPTEQDVIDDRVVLNEIESTKATGKSVQSSTLVTEYAAWFKSSANTLQDTIRMSVLLDTDSERNIISQRSAFADRIWSEDEETDVKPLPFLGRRGKMCEAKNKIRLTWHPEGSGKWMDTEFYIIDDDEPIVILGKEWADFQGIFHDMEFSISPFRLPGIRSTRAQKAQRRQRQENLDQVDQDLHESAQAEDRLERQLRMGAPPVQLVTAPTLSAVEFPGTKASNEPSSSTPGTSLVSPNCSSITVTPASSALALSTTTQSSSSPAAETTISPSPPQTAITTSSSSAATTADSTSQT